MKFINFILRKLYIVWISIIFIICTICFFPFIVFPLMYSHKGGRISYFFIKIFSKIFSITSAIQYQIIQKENINYNKVYIYVCNHTSYLDLPGISLTIPTQYRPLAKEKLKQIPIFGRIIQHASINVDHSNKKSKIESIKQLKKALNKGISILIFPEGTQNQSSETLQPFYKGAFKIAVETGYPILPITILNAGKLMPPHTLNIKSGTIKIIVGEEIKTTHLTLSDVSTLKQKTFDIIKHTIQKHSSMVMTS